MEDQPGLYRRIDPRRGLRGPAEPRQSPAPGHGDHGEGEDPDWRGNHAAHSCSLYGAFEDHVPVYQRCTRRSRSKGFHGNGAPIQPMERCAINTGCRSDSEGYDRAGERGPATP
jgi:hypothetical protein